MAGSKSNFLENELLDHVLGNAVYTAPATMYVAAFTAAPSDSGGGTEVSGGAYARVAVTNNATNWPAAASGVKSNGTAVSFAEATASWGTVAAAGIFDAPTAGNLLYWGDLAASKAIGIGDTLRFDPGDIVVTED